MGNYERAFNKGFNPTANVKARKKSRMVKVTVATADGEVLDSQEIEIPWSLVGLVTELEIGAVMPGTETPGYLGRVTIGNGK